MFFEWKEGIQMKLSSLLERMEYDLWQGDTDIYEGVRRADGEYALIQDRKEAIRYCISRAKEGDVIVLAGKGHEDYQEIHGKKYHMDDRELIREVLQVG